MTWSMSAVMAAVLALSLVGGCGKRTGEDDAVDYEAESAKAAGEQLAALDEGAAGSGITMQGPMTPAVPEWKRELLNLLSYPSAHAASCSVAGSWMCSTTLPSGAPAGVMSAITGDFSASCSVGSITLTGKTSIFFSTNNCRIPLNNDFLIRQPNYTFTGANGYTLKVSAGTSGGQKLQRTGVSSFDYSVLGVSRTASGPDGGVLFDIGTTTGSPIHITGLTRTGRTVTGGSLVVEHKLAQFSTTFVPTDLVWSSSCNCPTSGSLAATHSGGKGNFTVTMGSSCGAATLSGTGRDGGTVTASVQLEACHAL